MSRAPIPEFPGHNPQSKPKPPKFLEVQDKKGVTKLVKVGMDSEPEAAPSLRIIQPNSLARKQFGLVPSVLATSSAADSKTYDQVPHRYRSVDSKCDTKPEVVAAVKPTDFLPGSGGKLVPKYVSSTFHHMPNAPTIRAPPLYPPPKLSPALARPYVPAPASAFGDYPLLHNRTPDGRILGKSSPKVCDEAHVPYHPEPQSISSAVAGAGGTVLRSTSESRGAGRTGFGAKPVEHWDVSAVGEDTPYVQLNDTWSACWDPEARAVYFYNHETGEATWIPPPR
jgi:hypothetical protein